MRFVISYEKTYQVTEDSYRVGIRTLIVDENTTLGQINEWYKRDVGCPESRMDDLRINEPEAIL
jgi:hypothetical protein